MDHTDNIDYQIMVQRATQTAIWAMPGVALVDFTKATKRDLGGKMNDVVYLTKPLNSNHGFLTANDVTAYGWGSISTAKGPVVIEVPAATDKVSYFGSILNAWQQPLEDIGPAYPGFWVSRCMDREWNSGAKFHRQSNVRQIVFQGRTCTQAHPAGIVATATSPGHVLHRQARWRSER